MFYLFHCKTATCANTSPSGTSRVSVHNSEQRWICSTYQVSSDGPLCQHEGAFRYQEYLDIWEAWWVFTHTVSLQRVPSAPLRVPVLLHLHPPSLFIHTALRESETHRGQRPHEDTHSLCASPLLLNTIAVSLSSQRRVCAIYGAAFTPNKLRDEHPNSAGLRCSSVSKHCLPAANTWTPSACVWSRRRRTEARFSGALHVPPGGGLGDFFAVWLLKFSFLPLSPVFQTAMYSHSDCSLSSLLFPPFSLSLPPSHSLLCAHMALEAPCSSCKSAQLALTWRKSLQRSPGTLCLSGIPSWSIKWNLYESEIVRVFVTTNLPKPEKLLDWPLQDARLIDARESSIPLVHRCN